MRVLAGRLWVAGALIAGLAAAPAPSVAQTPAIDFTSPTIDFSNDNWSLGFEFDVLDPLGLTITHLGFYDALRNGLTENHPVGVWDAGQNLLASAVVGPGSPLIGWFRWTAIAPIQLAAGTGYRIAAVTGTELYTYDPNGFTTHPGVAYVRPRYDVTTGTTLLYPEDTNPEQLGYFGPNMMVATSTAVVPEPVSMILLGTGLAGVAAVRRRRRSGALDV